MAETSDRFAPLFSSVLGAAAVAIDADGVASLGIGAPTVRVTPTSVEQVGDALRVAAENDIVVVPTGSGSALTLGNMPHGDLVLLSTAGLTATLEYEPRDLTAVVQAGKTLAAVQEEAGAAGQTLALDPQNAARATVGGLVASNGGGPLRRAYGMTRDLCLGARVVLSDGSVVKCGGRVVKNVAGYDTTRLYVGSMGTLGVIVDASFRLHPLPEATGVVVGVGANWAGAVELASLVVASPVEPRFVELLDLGDPTWGADDVASPAPAVVVGFGGSPQQVEYQTEHTRDALVSSGAKDVRVDDDDSTWRTRFAEIVHEAGVRGDTVLRVSGVTTGVLPAMRVISDLVGTRDIGLQWLSHYASGVVYAMVSGASASTVADVLGRTRREVAKLGSRTVLESAPVDVRQVVDVWGPPTAPLDLMRQLKRRLDPTGTLNRGRFIRGLDS